MFPQPSTITSSAIAHPPTLNFRDRRNPSIPNATGTTLDITHTNITTDHCQGTNPLPVKNQSGNTAATGASKPPNTIAVTFNPVNCQGDPTRAYDKVCTDSVICSAPQDRPGRP